MGYTMNYFNIKRCLIIIYLIFINYNVFSEAKYQTLGVLEFENKGGITKDQAELLTNTFIASLQKTNKYKIISRNEISKVMDEQDFQRSQKCSDSDCAVEFGKILGARYMITGQMGIVGKTFLTIIHLIDVQSSEEINTVDRSFKGEIDNLLGVMDESAKLIVNIPDSDQIVQIQSPKDIDSIKKNIDKYKSLAVLDFEPKEGIDLSVCTLLMNSFIADLQFTEQFQIMSRTEIQKILSEQDFQFSEHCSDTDCAVKYGEIIGVRYIVTGQIGKIGNTYLVVVHLIDVSTSEEVKTLDRSYKGEVEQFLNVMKELAFELAECGYINTYGGSNKLEINMEKVFENVNCKKITCGAYNFKTDKFYVCTPEDKERVIHILDGKTGEDTGKTLNTMNLYLGDFKVFSICIDKEGVIYGGSTGTADKKFGSSLIRWENENAVPTQQFIEGMKFPRTIDIKKSGKNTVIAISGYGEKFVSGVNKILILKTNDGKKFYLADTSMVIPGKNGVAISSSGETGFMTGGICSGVSRTDKLNNEWYFISLNIQPELLHMPCPISYWEEKNILFLMSTNNSENSNKEYFYAVNSITGELKAKIFLEQNVATYGYGRIDLKTTDNYGLGAFIARSENGCVGGRFTFSFVDKNKIAPPVLEPRRSIANTLADFSDIQGKNNWYYGFYKIPMMDSSFILMNTFNKQNNLWETNLNGELLRLSAINCGPKGFKGKIYPEKDAQIMLTKRWISTLNGKIRIEGIVFKSDVNPDKACDGIDFYIINNGKTLFFCHILSTDGTGKKFVVYADAKQGEHFDFVISSRENPFADNTNLYAEISIK